MILPPSFFFGLRFERKLEMRLSLILLSIVLLFLIGLPGCGNIPTWQELTGGQPAPTPAPAAVAPAPVVTTPQVVVPAGPTPAEVIAKFKAVRNGDMSDQLIAELTNLNEGLEQITEINAAGSQITPAAFDNIDKLPNLQQLNLTGTKINNDTCAMIAKASTLETLIISHTSVNDIGIAALSGLTNLKELQLTSVQMTENGFQAIGTMPSLKTVVLDSTGMDNRKLNLLCNAKTLTKLTLPRNPFNDEGLIALNKLSDLEYLELGESQVSGYGLMNVTKKGGLKQLKFLGMYACPVNAAGAKAISTIKSLEGISLGNIGIMSDQDFAFIAQGMKNLKYVYLAKCTNLGGPGLQALKGCKDLEELHINQCSAIGDVPAVDIIKTFKNLKKLSCGGTAITPAGIARLKNALPDLTLQ